MKKILKNVFEFIMHKLFSINDINKLYDEISNYECVSFDIFDTLIKRNVPNPDDAFDLVEKVYNDTNPVIHNFREKRKQAYYSAKKECCEEEVTIDDIYNKIDFDDVTKQKLKKIELKIEIELCVKNQKVFNIYEKCILNNKKVYITSDMYLPINVIKEILHKNGYCKYESIYLSSNKRVTKRSGNLFKVLLKEQNVLNSNLVHIGDSSLNDFISPNKNKIHSILINRNLINYSYCTKYRNENYIMLKQIINNNIACHNYSDFYSKFGYEVFGPLLFGFVSWLHEKLAEDKMSKVFFLARDSKIIMDAYTFLYGNNNLKYVHFSRKSVALANMHDVENFEDMYENVKSIMKRTATVRDFFDVLNLNVDDYSNIMPDKKIFNLNDDEKEKIYESIEKGVKENSKKQYLLLKQYLLQNNINGKVAFVDIGWRGTIQYFIASNYNKFDIVGYYFGINRDSDFNNYDIIKRYGYLFNNSVINNNQSVVSLSIGIFETMFLNDEGTTVGYKEEKGAVIPIKGTAENRGSDVFKIQDGAMDFIKDIHNIGIDKYMSHFQNEVFFNNYKKFVINPQLQYIKWLSDVDFNGHNNKKLINNKSLLYYIFRPYKFIIDFNNSYCKIMFLKNIFKIKFPYYNVLNILYKVHKR